MAAAPRKMNFITGNKNKLAEVRAILGSIVEVDNQSVDVPEIQGTIEEIAKEKCRRAAEVVRMILPGPLEFTTPRPRLSRSILVHHSNQMMG